MTLGPLTDYLLINLHRNQYYPLSNAELKNCITSENEFICVQQHPLFSKGSKFNSCEISAISHWPWKSACQPKVISEPPHWIQLHQTNHWIYIIPRKTIINIVCDNELKQQILQGSGTIKIDSNCAIKDDMTTITGHNIYASKLKSGFAPAKLLHEFTNLTSLTSLVDPADTVNNITEDIKYIQEAIKGLKSKENLVSDIQQESTHHHVISYLGLSIVLIIVAYLITKYFYMRYQLNIKDAKKTADKKEDEMNPFEFQPDAHSLSNCSRRGEC